MTRSRLVLLLSVAGLCTVNWAPSAEPPNLSSTQDALAAIARMKVKPGDWPQRGGSHFRNNTPDGKNIPTDWSIRFGQNVKWSARLGSVSYTTPVVANGRVFIGSNNLGGYIKRYPSNVDLGVLLCFDEETGKFLWQHSNEKLAAGRVHDWPFQGVCSTPYVDGDRLWYVSNRAEIVCLDIEGFRDGENDGPFTTERPQEKVGGAVPIWDESIEADVVWKRDMINELLVFPHNMCCCSLTGVGNLLFVITGNGVDEGHFALPNPKAPSFLCIDRTNGKVLWSDNSPGENIIHGQWSSPCYGVFGGQAQVVFPGGDGWIYSFDPAGDGKGQSKLLWKFDGNPKDARFLLGGRATRGHFVATPVVYDGRIYIGTGEDPEHGEGNGHLWCLDPTRRGDISTELAFNIKDPTTPIAPTRWKGIDPAKGDFVKPNPNSGAIWHYEGWDVNGNQKLDFEEVMHRTIGNVVIKHDLLFAIDFSGVVHCLNARTGITYWTHDALDACWGSPLIVEDRMYIGTENGDIKIFRLSTQKELIAEVGMDQSVYSTPVVANNILYVASKDTLFALKEGVNSRPLRHNKPSDSAE